MHSLSGIHTYGSKYFKYPHTDEPSAPQRGWGEKKYPIKFKSWVYSRCIIGKKKRVKIKHLLAGAHIVIFVYEVKFNKMQTASVVYKQMWTV